MKTRIRELREAHGISRTQLSERCGVSYDAILRIETGKRKTIYIATLRKLAKGLGVPVEALIISKQGGKNGGKTAQGTARSPA